MVFAEIKHHGTQLLAANEYRPEVWAPTKELSGGVLQVQTTVHRAVSQIGERISRRDADGFETNDLTYLLRPRSFLIVGRLSEFTNSDGAHHRAKATSFELYRRHLHDPEIITFDELFARARAVIPGGVDSPVRAYGSVGGTPRFVTSASGAFVTDAEGRRYIDLVASWGPALVGHAHPEVVAAVQEAAARGLSFGAPTSAARLTARS